MKRLVLIVLMILAGNVEAQSIDKDLMGLGMSPELADYFGTILPGGGNNIYLNGRNAAGTADINMIKVDATDDTLINSDSGDTIKFQSGGDANRLLTYSAASDTDQLLTYGDGGSTASQRFFIGASTADTDDDSITTIAGGGTAQVARGSYISLDGNDVVGGGDVLIATGDSSGSAIELNIAGTVEATLTDDQLAFSGAAAEIVPGATSFTIKNTADAVDNLKITDAGAVTMAGASLGWSYVTGANTACTTTCTFAAVFGVDLAAGASAPVLVGPAAATADACICAGAN